MQRAEHSSAPATKTRMKVSKKVMTAAAAMTNSPQQQRRRRPHLLGASAAAALPRPQTHSHDRLAATAAVHSASRC